MGSWFIARKWQRSIDVAGAPWSPHVTLVCKDRKQSSARWAFPETTPKLPDSRAQAVSACDKALLHICVFSHVCAPRRLFMSPLRQKATVQEDCSRATKTAIHSQAAERHPLGGSRPREQGGRHVGWKNSLGIRAVWSPLGSGWRGRWEVGATRKGEVWLPEKAQLLPPFSIGQRKRRHVRDEVGLRGGSGLCVALPLGGSLRREETGAGIKWGAHRQC